MVTIYFCRDDYAPVMRHWPYVPRIGDTIALPEYGGSENQFSVYKVVCEGDGDPTISVYLHPDRTEQDGRFSANGHVGHATFSNPD
jgi:hypothetical protein